MLEYPVKEDVLASPVLAATTAKTHADIVSKAKQDFLTALPASLKTKVSFPSSAPVAYASLTPAEIGAVARTAGVARTSLQKPYVAQTSTYIDAVGAAGTGYTGSGVGVCNIDGSQPSTPNNLTIAGRYCSTGTTAGHMKITSGVMRSGASPYGVSTGISLYTSSWDGCDSNAAGALAWCDSTSHRIWNYSHSCSTTDDALFDYYAKGSNYVFSSIAAGNYDPNGDPDCGTACTGSTRTVPTCLSYNTLIVGASNDCATTTRSDDIMSCFSRDYNPSGGATGRELPLLVAPGHKVSTEGLEVSGTSFSAPIVAGAAAQLVEQNSVLAGWPEALRSILMTGATETVSGGPLDLGDSTDDADGAGELSIAESIAIGTASHKVNGGNTAASMGFDFGTLSSSVTPVDSFYSETYNATKSAWHRLRVVLSWDATATCTNPGSPGSVSCGTTSLDADLDIYVYRKSDGVLIASSTSSQNSYEFVEFDVNPSSEYVIKIYVYSWTASSTYFGLSWDITNFSTT